MSLDASPVGSRYADARDQYAELGVDTDAALDALARVPFSINCWQADDVAGLEGSDGISGGGILATGSYPGRARTGDEIRADFTFARTLIPGMHRFNLHAMYLEAPGIDRDAIEPEHFRGWMDWAQEIGVALDFNPSFFSHPHAADGFTLTHDDAAIRAFWIEHGKRSRRISAAMGAAQGNASINNFWIPDGMKDIPADRLRRRELLAEVLDEVFSEPLGADNTLDCVESKLFGIGSESYVVGSHEFYLAYALTRKVVLTMDAGHYHPAESIADKISALLPFVPALLLHVSRPVRWDSDHVVLFDDETRAIMREIHRADAWQRVYLANDFFDASINRISAWVIGIRGAMKAALAAMVEPLDRIRQAETDGDFALRLALQEEAKTLPFGAVWDTFCERSGVPSGWGWLGEVERYTNSVLDGRG